MSFGITLGVPGGSVMASDRRVTWNPTVHGPDRPAVHVAVSQTDTSATTVLTPGSVGISTLGDAASDTVPIAGHREAFLNETLSPGSDSVDSVAEKLLTYFPAFPAPPRQEFTGRARGVRMSAGCPTSGRSTSLPGPRPTGPRRAWTRPGGMAHSTCSTGSSGPVPRALHKGPVPTSPRPARSRSAS
jgi:hypothetical protein